MNSPKSIPPKPMFTASELVSDKKYCVIKNFTDYYGVSHPIGECWKFVEKHFLPYEDGLTLHCQKDGQDYSIHLQWREETQGEIIDNFYLYVQEVENQQE